MKCPGDVSASRVCWMGDFTWAFWVHKILAAMMGWKRRLQVIARCRGEGSRILLLFDEKAPTPRRCRPSFVLETEIVKRVPQRVCLMAAIRPPAAAEPLSASGETSLGGDGETNGAPCPGDMEMVGMNGLEVNFAVKTGAGAGKLKARAPRLPVENRQKQGNIEKTLGPVAETHGVQTAETITDRTPGATREYFQADPRQMVELTGHGSTILAMFRVVPRRMVELNMSQVPIHDTNHGIRRQMVEMHQAGGMMQDLLQEREGFTSIHLTERKPLSQRNEGVGNLQVNFAEKEMVGMAGSTSATVEDSEDLGTSARSYLRQVEAWRRMTQQPVSQQGLVLYQHLSGRAWIAAEELSVARLGTSDGVAYFIAWITTRFLDLEITRIGRAFSDFFRRLRRRPGQSVREYNTEYDRLHARLREVGCNLPEDCAAWLYIDRLQLEEAQELNLLASVGNQYNLAKLQQAAVLHDRSHRKPWEAHSRKRTNTAHMTDFDSGEYMMDDEINDDADKEMPEEVAQAWVTYQSAKDKYKAQQRARGFAGDKDKSEKGNEDREAKIRAVKQRSFCAGCGRRGHWHKDSECPLNRGGGQAKGEGNTGKGDYKDVAMTTVLPAEIYALRHEDQLYGVADTACARTVAGTQWLQCYADKMQEMCGRKPQLHKECEAYRFGTGKIHYSSFFVVVEFELGNKVVQLRTSIIAGDIPLLLSRTVLGKLGMIFDVGAGTATFNALGLTNFSMLTTPSGHPAIPIVPASVEGGTPALAVEDIRLQSKGAYMEVCAVACPRSFEAPQLSGVYFPKKLDPGVNDMLGQDRLHQATVDHWDHTQHLQPTFPLLWVGRRTPLSRMTRTELLEETMRCGLTVHRNWASEELRAIIREYRETHAAADPSEQMKKITKMTLDELKMKADELQVPVPPKATKGLIMRLIRDNLNTPANELISFGRWRGYEYREVPDDYGRWAASEVKQSPNAHPDLVRYARWWEGQQEAAEVGDMMAAIDRKSITSSPPYPSSHRTWPKMETTPALSTSSRSNASWESVQAPATPPRTRAKMQPSSSTSGRNETRTSPSTTTKRKETNIDKETQGMDAETDPRVLEEITELETKLALLKEGEYITEEEYVRAYRNQQECYITDGPQDARQKEVKGEEESDESEETIEPDSIREAFMAAIDWKDFSFSTCLGLLDGAGLPEEAFRPRAMLQNDGELCGQAYATFGMFTHGGIHGVTAATRKYADLVRYLNDFGAHHLGREATWTAISVSRNVAAGVHRDSNNERGSRNYCISLGQQAGGGIWVEEDRLSEQQVANSHVVWKKDKVGAWVPGKVRKSKEEFVIFDPFLRHATESWDGDRWGLFFHTPRGGEKVAPELKKLLRNCRFPIPKKGAGGTRMRTMPTKTERNKMFNAAGKVSVLMTMLMTASMSLAAEAVGSPVEHDPIVMMEIGGVEGTIEATDLGKAVIEPMMWEDMLNPDQQETASHFVAGVSPRELRIHVDGMPERLVENVGELIRAQIDGGGDVVLRGGCPREWTEKFKMYERYRDDENGDLWIVLSKPKEKGKVMYGGGRPHEVCAVEAGERGPEAPRMDGSGITFDEGVPGHVQASLRRMHQNLGHPRVQDMVRHLRLAGCEGHILKAAKGMKCSTCDATRSPQVARGTTLPRLLDFNSCVGVDIFYVHDTDDVKHAMLSMVDWATTYHVVARLGRETGEDVEKAFNTHWLSTFGPPSTVSLDLDGKVQAGLGRLCDWHSIKIKDVAAQGHWQAGVTERQGGWFKGIWDRVVHEMSISGEEVELAVNLVTAAKNDLRRRCGHSPTQWVFGRSPRLPAGLNDIDGGEDITWDLTQDSKHQRVTAIRASARIAYHRAQGDDRLRKSLMQRARTTRAVYDISDPVHYWHQPKDRRRARWVGPAVVVGKQGQSYWVSRNGRCRLTAPEHLRTSGPEELGEYLAMKGVRHEVEKLLGEDIDDPDVYDDYDMMSHHGDEGLEENVSDYVPSLPGEGDPIEFGSHGEDQAMEEEEDAPEVRPMRRLKRKTNPSLLEGPHEAMITRKELTRRGHAKRQEKELRWAEIPEFAREKFKAAEKVQWDEHLSFDALEPLDTKATQQVLDSVDHSRILRCRWAYKDKNWAARQCGENPEWKCKSRLVIGGHLDPDLGVEDLTTDAPTISRPGFMCMMQLLANGLACSEKWSVAAGDIRCAFLTGGYLSRDEPLYLHQPTTGFPGMLPGQIVRIKKNIFGLATSPHEWWQDLQGGMKFAELHIEGATYKFDQCPLDPCVFMLRRWQEGKFSGKPIAYVGSHVDDLLVIGPKKVNKEIQRVLSEVFPVDEWIEDLLTYLGSEICCEEDRVKVTQKRYTENRLFTVDLQKGIPDDAPADAEVLADNRSLIGALSWLSAQTRPDLTCSVSLAQQTQKGPSFGDVKFTNGIAGKAMKHKERGLCFKPVPYANMMILVYHDAAWANAFEGDYDEPGFELTEEDKANGLQHEGPASLASRKAKKANSRVASQLGNLVLFAEKDCVQGKPGNVSIADWRSQAGQRVCRSTFGAETQASVEGIENGQYMRSFIETLVNGTLVKVEQCTRHLLCLSDCRSLYDHIHKEGIPRTPSDRRLAIDLAALRQTLRAERWGSKLPLGWVPSVYQLGDILTKPQDADGWWEKIDGKLSISVRGVVANVKGEEDKTSVKH
ncbi:RE2 [Symbiodinium natans]|uniref:RE2 protein n=1 Tax=Symbiodinium natans TaxID=878477 RepID=A0A812TWI1_9DINO|nr:RE2 [Symbiodinium natans]